MTTRSNVERAVRASDLPPSERLVVFVLLQHADNDTAVIDAKYTPSLSGLASETGLDRTTVARILSRLESQGWVHRQRPPVEESRKGARTRYRMIVPDLVASGTTPPRVSKSLDVSKTNPRAGARSDGSRNGKPGTDWATTNRGELRT